MNLRHPPAEGLPCSEPLTVFSSETIMTKTTFWRYLRPALAALGLSTLVAGGGLREDEIDCEQAAAHLEECCPGFHAGAVLRCEYDDGCGIILPDLSIDDSQC